MSLDLTEMLNEWPHEPGQIKVRKIVGKDGAEKIQLRLDLGLIQMEIAGRPDGLRPKNCESLLTYHRNRARAAERQGKDYVLTPDDCNDLQAEGVQYYHRYLSLFQLDDFPGVVRDTQRNLELFAFVREHTDREEIAWAFEQFVPYVTMMHTRARAAIELEKKRLDAAMRFIEKGRESIVEFYRDHEQEEMLEKSAELGFLDEWRDQLRAKRPMTKVEKLQREMDKAIAIEAYEKAAELRDAIKALASSPRRSKASSNKS
ncbi:MAG: UvrB/UvrC motif-containing protein [Verrucomicrobia bacterium]|nr:UvrB/UvrC motif-containing protein [Verrucomicrobiota bacterium]MBV9659005.1 UvrB/UvrC motif-containing protein [Verrucomicrobiota bacterium]